MRLFVLSRSFLHPWFNLANTTATNVAVRRSFSNCSKCLAKPSAPASMVIDRIRNIGILAHIDSGKTTLTESILAKSGYISAPGTVDLGTTSTDFLPSERERGITIQSATIPVSWKDHIINVVDTPGHIDFTIEVERAARVIDGGIVLLDAVEGVEAQSRGVWSQLDRYTVTPRILFINKLDRAGASLNRSLTQTKSLLHPHPLLLNLPITTWDASNGASGEPGIVGFVDIVSGRLERWEGDIKTTGWICDELRPTEEEQQRQGAVVKLPESHPVRDEFFRSRAALIELLSTLSDGPLMEEFFALADASSTSHPHLLLPLPTIYAALRELTISGSVLPALCGSAFKGIGTEAILDAAVRYLPSPKEVGPAVISQVKRLAVGGPGAGVSKKSRALVGKSVGGKELGSIVRVEDKEAVAFAFKVIWDDQKGWMTFVRVYSGTITRATLFNTTSQLQERASRLMLLYADEPLTVDELPSGSIGVLLGLKHTRTGDTLVGSKDARQDLQLRGVDLPVTVCSVALTPEEGMKMDDVLTGLERLVRQDPSLRLEVPSEDAAESTSPGLVDGNQILLHGMGQLHLEISLTRLLDEQKVRVKAGKTRIALRETILETIDEGVVLDNEWTGSVIGLPGEHHVSLRIQLSRLPLNADIKTTSEWDSHQVSIPVPPTDAYYDQLPHLTSYLLSSLRRGGPLAGYPLSHLCVTLTPYLPTPTSPVPPLPAVAKAIEETLRSSLTQIGVTLIEPVLDVRIRGLREADVGKVTGDLVGRRGSVDAVDEDTQVSSTFKGSSSTGQEDNGIYIPPHSLSPSYDYSSSSSSSASGHQSARSSIRGVLPLFEMGEYMGRLRSLSGGEGTLETSDGGWKELDLAVAKSRDEDD